MVEGSATVRALRAGWPALLWAAMVFVVSHQSQPVVPLPPFDFSDKAVHAGVYAVLAGLTARALLAGGLAGRRALWIALVAASLYGASDEWHQSFVPGRDPDPLDWVADTVGALLGAALVVGLPRRRSRASIRG